GMRIERLILGAGHLASLASKRCLDTVARGGRRRRTSGPSPHVLRAAPTSVASVCSDGGRGGPPSGAVADGVLAPRAGCRGAAEGVAAVKIRHCNHIGRLGHWVEQLAGAGMTGFVGCNTGVCVAPYGGRTRMLGTNPFAWAAPRRDGPPLLVDFATAAVPEGK